MLSSKGLKEIVTIVRPIIERQLDDAEQIAAFRDKVADSGGDWSALKALIKAQIQDERDETGDGKRVKKILEKAGFSTGYAELLGWSNMNEKNFSAEEDYDRETGEVLDRDARRRRRTTEAMDDHKSLVDEMADAGLISEEARHENKALADAVAIKFGNGPAMPLRSDGGLSILTKHEDIRTAPVTAEEHPHHLKTTRGDESGTLEGSVEDHGQVAGCKPESQTDGNETVTVVGDESGTVTTPKVLDGGSPVAGESRHHCDVSEDDAGQTLTGTPHSEKATVATQGEATEPTSAEREDRAAANAGGTDVARSATRAGLADPTSNTGEGAANTALPANGVTKEYCPPTGVRRSSFAHYFPEPSKDQRAALERDIIDNRVQVPIIRQGNVILDGWARYTIARGLGQSYPVKEYDGDDELLDVIEWQRASRNFTQAQEKKVAADLAKAMPDRAADIMAAFGLAEELEAAE